MQPPERYVKVHELAGGLRAAFVQLPHFRTTSARLTINSGSLHELDGTQGAAHFLEHLTFQGTEELPSEVAIEHFQEENDVLINASTNRTHTTYSADGYELEPTLDLLTQVALFPTLDAGTIENERAPIIEEIRSKAASPYYSIEFTHSRAIHGERYAKPGIGSVEDVRKLSTENLIEFYDRNYRLRNAELVVCSKEPPEKQLEYVESLLANRTEHGKDKPTAINLQDFNPDGISSSLQLIEQIPDAQTDIAIYYGLPEVFTLEEWQPYGALASILSTLVSKRLRTELKLSYGGGANTQSTVNFNFGANRSWSELSLGSRLSGDNAVPALDAILHDVLQKPLPEDIFNAARRNTRRAAEIVYQWSPSGIADRVIGRISTDPSNSMDLEETRVAADRISLQALRHLQEEITATKPLIIATSPDPTVLEKIGEWARKI